MGGHLRDLIHDLGVTGLEKMVQTQLSRHVFVSQVQVYWIMLGDPENGIFPARSNEELEVTLLPRGGRVGRRRKEGVWPESGMMRSSSDSTESGNTLEERVVCNGLREDSGSVQEQDRTPEEGVACTTSQGGRAVVVQV